MLSIKNDRADYFLRKLGAFGVCSRMLHIFYMSVVESAISSSVICWGDSITASDTQKKKLNKLIEKGGCTLRTALEPLQFIVQRRKLHEVKNILQNTVILQQIVWRFTTKDSFCLQIELSIYLAL